VQISLNEYQAGTQAYTTVVTAQATQLANEQTALSVQENRLLASVALIQALGGGWQSTDLPSP
jgi:outer membrane protein TolC